MSESFTDTLLEETLLKETLRDPSLTWVAITEAAREHREEELAEIAISLYGQLGEARAEVSRLRASLRSSLRALAPARLGGWA
jgi:hypothetical protein